MLKNRLVNNFYIIEQAVRILLTLKNQENKRLFKIKLCKSPLFYD